MNKLRRKEIQKIIDSLSSAAEQLEMVKEEEEEYLDNMPENLQGSEKYEKSEEYCSIMADACSEIENIIMSLEEIIEA